MLCRVFTFVTGHKRRVLLGCAGVVCAVLLLSTSALAATPGQRLWVRTYRVAGSAVFRDVATGARGAAYAVGNKNVNGSTSLILVKYDGAGHQRWVRAFKGAYLATYGFFVDVDARGNVYVGGRAAGRRGGILLVKYGADGTLKWSRTWNSGNLASVALDRAGSVYLTATRDVGADISGLVLAKYDARGRRLWAVRYPDPTVPTGLGAYPSDLALDGKGGVYVTGAGSIQPDSGGQSTALTLKFSGADGSLLARAVYGDASYGASARSVDVRGSTVAVCGSVRDQFNVHGMVSALVINYDLSLGQRYAAEYRPPWEWASAYAVDVGLDPGGNTIATGWSTTPTTLSQTQGPTTLGLGPDGALRWQQTHNLTGLGGAGWLRVDDSGDSYVGCRGEVVAGGQAQAFLVIRYGVGGDPVWTRTWVDGAGYAAPYCFALGADGVYMGGQIRAHSRAVLVKWAR